MSRAYGTGSRPTCAGRRRVVAVHLAQAHLLDEEVAGGVQYGVYSSTGPTWAMSRRRSGSCVHSGCGCECILSPLRGADDAVDDACGRCARSGRGDTRPSTARRRSSVDARRPGRRSGVRCELGRVERPVGAPRPRDRWPRPDVRARPPRADGAPSTPIAACTRCGMKVRVVTVPPSRGADDDVIFGTVVSRTSPGPWPAGLEPDRLHVDRSASFGLERRGRLGARDAERRRRAPGPPACRCRRR